jgi:vacuolar-type H+-ATPase subunit E/Vma4
MTLDGLIEEIRARSEAELAATAAAQQAEVARIVADRDRRIQEIREQAGRAAAADAARERGQRIAAAKLQARKLLYEARERRLEQALRDTRALLADFAQRPEYAAVLKRMVDAATDALGKQIRVQGRAEDAPRLSKVAGKAFDPAPLPILGGLVAETTDGSRRLNLSFDELLRLREDRVRGLLA